MVICLNWFVNLFNEVRLVEVDVWDCVFFKVVLILMEFLRLWSSWLLGIRGVCGLID